MAGKLRISLFAVAIVIAGFIVFSIVRGNLDFAYFIRNQLLISSEKTSIVQHVFFQGIIQVFVLLIFFLLITRWKYTKYALAGLILLAGMELIAASRLNGPYSVYSHIFSSKEIYVHTKQYPDGFPVPGTNAMIENRDTKGLAFKSLWRNMNIFHKQISYEGYNPLHLKGFEEMADNHPKLFETILQNPVVYLADKVSPMDSISVHERNNDFDRRRVYFGEDEYLMLKVEGLMLNEGDSLTLKSFSPVKIIVNSRTEEKALLNLLQNNYYGWEATIDGQEADVFTGNLGFLSVLVPAGEHEVVFSFSPKSVKVGFWISLVACVSGIGLLSYKRLTTKDRKVFSQRHTKKLA